MASDAALLSAAAAEGALKHAHYFQGGVIGGELLTLSKHPITEVSMQGRRRPLQGLAAPATHQDCSVCTLRNFIAKCLKTTAAHP